MADIASWAWTGTGTWPSFSVSNQNNGRALGNGLNISPGNYTSILWRDANNNGVIADNDSDDGSGSGTDRVVVNGVVKRVHETATYNNSPFTVRGVSYTAPIDVWIFTDGTYMVRLRDVNIPAAHWKKVTAIRLGTWDGAEYSGSNIATRDNPFVCFTAGTCVETPDGPRPVEGLRAGDLVLTLDHGPQPLLWSGKRLVRGTGAAAPVLFQPGALGNSDAVRVSPHHRVLLTGWKAELFAGTPEVLVTAHHLVDGKTILRDPCDLVLYVHLLFARHELLDTAGLLSESFHPTRYALDQLADQERQDLLTRIPQLAQDPRHYGATARRCVTSWEARAIAA